MESLFSIVLSVKLPQLLLMLTLSTVAFLYGMTRIALLIQYAFVLYWGYIANMDQFFHQRVDGMYQVTGFYFAFGLVIFILSLLAFFVYRD